MINIISKFKKTPYRTYAPKMLFYEARAVLAAYVRTAHPADKMNLLERGKIREEALVRLIEEEPEGMVPFDRLQRIVRLIEIYEAILTYDYK